MAKQSTSYRLTPEALALVEDLVARTGLSHAGVIELSLRQTARWLEMQPAGAAEDLEKVRQTDPPPASRVMGRPRKAAESTPKQRKAGGA